MLPCHDTNGGKYSTSYAKLCFAAITHSIFSYFYYMGFPMHYRKFLFEDRGMTLFLVKLKNKFNIEMVQALN